MPNVIAHLSICTCCLLVHANGECCAEPHDVEPLSRVDCRLLALGTDEHSCGLSADERSEQECDCEQLGFSWRSCDACGSDLGGDRHAAVLFDE